VGGATVSWLVVAPLVLAGGIGAQAGPGSADRPLTIRVRDYASIARPPMGAAMSRVKTIFANAGVPARITVLDATQMDDVDDDEASDATVTVLVYPRTRSDTISADTKVLGIAPGAEAGGHVAYVFASRVEVLARRHAVDYGTLLGVVLAHEVGHVLLRGRPHASAGLMRAVCGGTLLKNVILAKLAFTTDEAAAIRDSLF
jgi:hypothetical protein